MADLAHKQKDLQKDCYVFAIRYVVYSVVQQRVLFSDMFLFIPTNQRTELIHVHDG